ncbi:hypothetical protein N7466_007178 [Penicillium verhagenii]|uniref:uncharacterized protein n=1 Tax=Penicillium verhagenii TaxID=1562060 RepID=UPI002545337A|nr:uncharacterized protein N7466_007178 [Penicillium verhagenii]KAJ5928222.1 hypothetical protein N7466_007178 [Penicillium verhagenii]
MSSFDPAGRIDVFSLAKNIKKLETDADWRKWSEDMNQLIRAYDTKCWQILQGLAKKPAGPSVDQIHDVPLMTAYLTSIFGTVERIPTDAMDKLQKALSDWDQINCIGCMVLKLTVSPGAATMINNMFDLREAYLILKKAYHRTSYPNSLLMWDKIMHLQYKKEDTAHSHLQRFQLAIQNILADYPSVLGNTVIFCMFISSIQYHPDIKPFTTNLIVDTHNITDTVLAGVYSRFLLSDSIHKLHQNHQKSNNSAAATTVDKPTNVGKGKNRSRKRGKRKSQDKSSSGYDSVHTDNKSAWCPKHGSWGNHVQSKCRLSEDKWKNQAMPKSNAATSEEDTTSSGEYVAKTSYKTYNNL